jgi:hypothetical protein
VKRAKGRNTPKREMSMSQGWEIALAFEIGMELGWAVVCVDFPFLFMLSLYCLQTKDSPVAGGVFTVHLDRCYSAKNSRSF